MVEQIELSPGVVFKKVKVSSLKPNPWNPNEMGEDVYKFLISRIKKVGFRDPILTMKDGTIIDGEHRWKALKEVGTKETWVIQTDDDLVTAQEETINMNLIKGDFNPIRLGKLIAGLVDEKGLEDIANNIVVDSAEIEAMIDLVSDLPANPDFSTSIKSPRFAIEIVFHDVDEYKAVKQLWEDYKDKVEQRDDRIAFKQLLGE